MRIPEGDQKKSVTYLFVASRLPLDVEARQARDAQRTQPPRVAHLRVTFVVKCFHTRVATARSIIERVFYRRLSVGRSVSDENETHVENESGNEGVWRYE